MHNFFAVSNGVLYNYNINIPLSKNKKKNKKWVRLIPAIVVVVVLAILGFTIIILSIGQRATTGKNNLLASISTGAPSYLGAPSYAPPSTYTNGGPGEGGPTSVPVNNNIGGESGPRDVTDECGNPNVTIISPANGAHLSGNFDVVAKAHLCQRPNQVSPFHTVVFSNNNTTLGSTVPGSKQTYFSYLKCSDGSNDYCATVHFVQISPGNNTVLIVGYGANGQTTARASIQIINDTKPGSSNQSSNNTASQIRTNSNIGTLNALVENGYMYLYGPMSGYLGLSTRIINLYTGNYVLYAISRYSGRLCYNRNISISGGRTTLVKAYGTCY